MKKILSILSVIVLGASYNIQGSSPTMKEGKIIGRLGPQDTQIGRERWRETIHEGRMLPERERPQRLARSLTIKDPTTADSLRSATLKLFSYSMEALADASKQEIFNISLINGYYFYKITEMSSNSQVDSLLQNARADLKNPKVLSKYVKKYKSTVEML